MYSFQAGGSRRKSKQITRLLYLIIFILVIALAGVSFAYVKAARVSGATSDALIARAVSEAGAAQSAVYRLTQSSGTNTASQLASVRGHVYVLQSLNTLTANIYGAGTIVADADLLSDCVATLDECDLRLQAGSVLTDLTTQLRDQIDELVRSFGEAG